MTKRIAFFISLAAVCILAMGLALRGSSALGRADAASSWGFDMANLDRSCQACDDFYQFAAGGWMNDNPIPAEYPLWGSFVELADKNQQTLRGILEQAAAIGGTEEASKEKCLRNGAGRRQYWAFGIFSPPPKRLRTGNRAGVAY